MSSGLVIPVARIHEVTLYAFSVETSSHSSVALEVPNDTEDIYYSENFQLQAT